MSNKKKPGILTDPWRAAANIPPTERPTIPAKSSAKLKPDATLNTVGDTDTPICTLSIAVKGYGGITIHAPEIAGSAGSVLLNFCVSNLALVDDTLVEFGVLVEKLELSKTLVHSPIYLQRSDGWTLTVPGAATKDAARVQLIQAFLKLNTYPKVREQQKK